MFSTLVLRSSEGWNDGTLGTDDYRSSPFMILMGMHFNVLMLNLDLGFGPSECVFMLALVLSTVYLERRKFKLRIFALSQTDAGFLSPASQPVSQSVSQPSQVG